MKRHFLLAAVSLMAITGLSSCGPLDSGSDMLMDGAPMSGNAQYESTF